MVEIDTNPEDAYDEGFTRGYAAGYDDGIRDQKIAAEILQPWMGKVTNE